MSAYAGSHSPARELRQVLLLLLVGAGDLEPERAELLHREDERRRRADLPDLLDRDEREERAGAEPAVLLVEEEPEDVVLAEELDDVPRELVRLVDLSRARRDPLARELADEIAQLALLVGQDVPGHAAILRGDSIPSECSSTAAWQPTPVSRGRAGLVRATTAPGCRAPPRRGGGRGCVALGEQQPRPHQRLRGQRQLRHALALDDARSRSTAVRASASAPASSHDSMTASRAASQLRIVVAEVERREARLELRHERRQ